MSNACETMRVPGFSSFISFGISFTLSDGSRYSVTTDAPLRSCLEQIGVHHLHEVADVVLRHVLVGFLDALGSMSKQKPRAPYFRAAVTGMRPSPQPRSYTTSLLVTLATCSIASTTASGVGTIDHVGAPGRRRGLRGRRRDAGKSGHGHGQGERRENDYACEVTSLRSESRQYDTTTVPAAVAVARRGLAGGPGHSSLAGAAACAVPRRLSRCAPRGRPARSSSPAQVPTIHLDSPLAPDGRQLVYPAAKAGVVTLWLQDLRTGETRALPGTDRRGVPFWSADGSRIGFFAGGQLRVLDLRRGHGRRLSPTPHRRAAPPGTRAGDIVFAPAAERRADAKRGRWIDRAADDVDRHGETAHVWPSFLDDGRHVVFLVTSSEASRAGIWIAPIDDPSNETALIAADAQPIVSRAARCSSQRSRP